MRQPQVVSSHPFPSFLLCSFPSRHSSLLVLILQMLPGFVFTEVMFYMVVGGKENESNCKTTVGIWASGFCKKNNSIDYRFAHFKVSQILILKLLFSMCISAHQYSPLEFKKTYFIILKVFFSYTFLIVDMCNEKSKCFLKKGCCLHWGRVPTYFTSLFYYCGLFSRYRLQYDLPRCLLVCCIRMLTLGH